jgi:hypothetical protein
VAHLELYLVSRRGKKPGATSLAFAEAIRKAAAQLAG